MKEEIENIYLDHLSRKYPAKVPEGYFDALTGKVMDKSREVNFSARGKVSVRFVKPAIGFAASVLVFFTLVFLQKEKIFQDEKQFNQALNQTFDVELLLKYHLSDQTIFEALNDSEADNQSTNDSLESELLASVSEYELFDLTH